MKPTGPKILIFDIETSPIISYTWGLWDQNVGLNQIKEDWFILSWGAKWFDPDNPKVMYQDNRHSNNLSNDKPLLKAIWNLLDEADIVVTQNGVKFDQKKLNARFIINGMQPPSSFKHIDTLLLAKRYFGFTSNKLEYMADKLNTKYKKLKHSKYAGFELWKECLAGNQKAWKEMEKYNKHDVLSLEELFTKLRPWDNKVNVNAYHNGDYHQCSCGSLAFQKRGFFFSPTGKFQRYRCSECGSETRDRVNLLSKEKKKSLKAGTTR